MFGNTAAKPIEFFTNNSKVATFASGGGITFVNLTTAAGTPNSICQNDATKEITVNAALTCTVSSRLFKGNITDLPKTALTAFDRLRPVQFVYRDHPDRTRYGFISEEANAADKQFADGYDANGKNPTSIDQNAILAATVAEVQALKRLVAAQTSRITAVEKENARLRRITSQHRK